MSFTLCTSGAAVTKAGIHANSDITVSSTALDNWADEAEGRIEAETRRTWVEKYSTLTTPVKNALSDVCSSLVAMNIVNYDPTGYLISEADRIMNFNDDRITKGIQVLKDFKSNSMQTP